MADNREIATNVLKAVGGKENVSMATHCMTRLRFNLKDEGKVSDDEVKAIDGVLGVVRQGGQYQVIIGQKVPHVYKELCAIGGFDEQAAVDENLDEDAKKEPLTAKKVGQAILDYLSGSMVPIVPVLTIAGLFKVIQVVLGPTMLNLIGETSDLWFVSNMVYNAGFYFLPMYLGYTSAKKLGVRPILGLLLAAIIIEPSFVALAGTEGASLTVFGIPAAVVNYSQSVMPILLSVWVMKYVERFFDKHIPEALVTVFVPFLTILVMLPVTLCVTAPLGSFLGNALGTALFNVGNAGGIVSVIAVAALMVLQPFLVITGMHMALITLALAAYAQNGADTFAIVCNLTANWAVWGMALAIFLRVKDPNKKGVALGAFISGVIGGVTEPALFGLGFKYNRCLIGVAIANAVAGLIAGFAHVSFYNMGASSVLALLNFISPTDPMNVVWAAVAGLAGFGISTVINYFFGLTPEQINEGAE